MAVRALQVFVHLFGKQLDDLLGTIADESSVEFDSLTDTLPPFKITVVITRGEVMQAGVTIEPLFGSDLPERDQHVTVRMEHPLGGGDVYVPYNTDFNEDADLSLIMFLSEFFQNLVLRRGESLCINAIYNKEEPNHFTLVMCRTPSPHCNMCIYTAKSNIDASDLRDLGLVGNAHVDVGR